RLGAIVARIQRKHARIQRPCVTRNNSRIFEFGRRGRLFGLRLFTPNARAQPHRNSTPYN
ncbi:MAG: hypothetical protein KBG15_04890, partial [Kofleriaceae bacterium]|nr:hypothetical protein [Kofleriaceae bacterium]